jgi:hypothetical protein
MRDPEQRGVALLLCVFALLLLSAIGAFLYMSSGTETHIAANYGSGLDAYYAAKFGLQEVRDRINYSSAPPNPAGGLADLLPQDIAGNSNGVLYVLNPAGGEVLDPTDPANRYFDDQLCHDYNSGVSTGSKCNVIPAVAHWALAPQFSLAPAGTASALKWVRINMKTNRTSDPFFVDPTNLPATLDLPVCWDGIREQLSPGGTVPTCDANGMQSVFLLTSLAVAPGLRDNAGRRLLRSEVVAPSIRPAGAITMDSASAAPVLSDGNSVPRTSIDGRPHKLDGTLSASNRCSAVASMATDQAASSTQLIQALNNARQNIVQTANASCNWDGSSINPNVCTPGLWWVRGTDASPRFVTTISGSSNHHNASASGGGGLSLACDPTSASCYTNLNLAAPELLAVSAAMAPHVPAVTSPVNPSAPFIGGPGNQSDPTIYQSSLIGTLPHQISTLSALVASSVNQSNYFAVSSMNLAPSYGSNSNPAIVVITDSSLNLLNTSLSGYGVLVVPNDLELNNSTLQWNGIVLVQSGNAQFKVGSGGNGYINGALMLQPGGILAASLLSSTPGSGSFAISYSCEAIDMAFGSLPFKVVSSSEFSY